jgi:hypothetical protein
VIAKKNKRRADNSAHSIFKNISHFLFSKTAWLFLEMAAAQAHLQLLAGLV